ncbi:hypothetical protein BS47DRAFT_1310242, partial [Hydnum rufescens UP504]
MTGTSENNTVDAAFETFIPAEDYSNEMVTTEFKPGNNDIPVAEENQEEYVETVIEYCNLCCSIDVFDERALRLLIGGKLGIDVDDWTKSTDYQECEMNDKVILKFWQAIQSWPIECKPWLLLFVIKTSRISIIGDLD